MGSCLDCSGGQQALGKAIRVCKLEGWSIVIPNFV